LYELDELKVAQVAFEEALIIQRALLRTMTADSMDMSEGQLLGIASTQSNLASIKLIHGQFDDALVDLEEALLIQQCVLSDDHPIVKRTQESLVWVETSRLSPQRSSSIGTDDAGNCLVHLPSGAKGKEDDPAEEGPVQSFSMLDVLERKFMAFRATFEYTCGGFAAEVSDDESI
jgi:hypothetical protein